jgi:hypothetical protein
MGFLGGSRAGSQIRSAPVNRSHAITDEERIQNRAAELAARSGTAV